MDPLQCAIALAKEAGALLLDYRGRPLEEREKSGRGDLVTAADRASERLVAARLREAFPHSEVIGEEGTAHPGTSGERWIVDPLDGTTNFAHGYPLFCVSIAYERDGELECGTVFAPVLDELYTAERGGGASCNGHRLEVSETAVVARSLVCTGFVPARFERNLPHFAHLSSKAQAVRRDGSAALDLAFVAAGRFDGFWEFDLSAWDVAAGALLVREAGGTVTATDGGLFRLDGGAILATNGRIHAEMAQALDEAGG